MEEIFQFAEVCNYLLGLENKDKKFIWLVTADSCSEEELYLLFKLGVCVHIVQNDNFSNLVISIKNIKKFRKKRLQVPYLNCSSRSFVHNGEHVELTKKEYLLFEILYDNFGNTVTYNEIANKLWRDDKQIVKPKIANVIHGLRRKISIDLNISIRTVSTVGYKLLIE
nr:helix-turn-helix domain-containing protein [Enterococcus plantarum]